MGLITSTFVGDGTNSSSDGMLSKARFLEPEGVAIHVDDLYVSEPKSNTIRNISLSTGQVGTFISSTVGTFDSLGILNHPVGLVVDIEFSVCVTTYIMLSEP
jgi:hypothetical protein